MNNNSVQSIDRAFDILEALSTENKGLPLVEISNRVSLHKSTVHRILATLIERGYVEKCPQNGYYKVGVKLLELCSVYLNGLELKTEAQPLLRELARIYMQPVHLAVLDNGEVVYIDKIENINSIRLYSSIGKRVPIYCTALGKILVTPLSNDEIVRMLDQKEIKKYTNNTKIDVNEILNDIYIAKTKGYAVDNEEFQTGVVCISAPIYDYRGKIIAAISISGSKNIFTKDKEEEIAMKVMETAKKISYRMGYKE